MDEEPIKLQQWFPVANKYDSNGNIDYRFPWITERIKNSPSWTEFDVFVRDMVNTLRAQRQSLENVPTKSYRKRPDNIGGYTLFTPTSHVERTKDGGNI